LDISNVLAVYDIAIEMSDGFSKF